MPIINSALNPDTQQFKSNRDSMHRLIGEFRAIEQKVIEKAIKSKPKFDKLDKLLPRKRIELLLDPGSPFLELSTLAGYMMHDDKDGSGAGGGIIAGIGYVEGIRCMVTANNSAVKGGTISPTGLRKTLRIQEIAMENKLPCINLSESGGANLHHASEIFVEGARTFANQSRLSAAGIPQITIVHGNATAGGAYQPGLSDYVIVVRNRCKMFLAGPPLLKAATGEIASAEELGGAELHASIPGTAEYLAEDDADAIRMVREIIRKIPWNQHDTKSTRKSFKEPRYNPEELTGIIPDDPKVPYDCREIIARIADDSDFLDFKINYDNQTVCGWLEIEGRPAGFIGNNGPITSQGATKAAQFIQLCDQSQTPILFFHNTTGFLVGTDPERNGIIKHGAKMIQAVANTRVPKFTMVIGGSYGAGNYAMCGRGLDPRFIFAWPNSKTAVMGGAQAGRVLRIVAEEKQRLMGVEPDIKVLEHLELTTATQLEQESTALYGTAHLWDDGLIDPRDTRKILAYVMDITVDADNRKLQSNTFGVARL